MISMHGGGGSRVTGIEGVDLRAYNQGVSVSQSSNATFYGIGAGDGNNDNVSFKEEATVDGERGKWSAHQTKL